MRLTLITTCFILAASCLFSQSNDNAIMPPTNIYETVRNLAFQQNDFAQALSLLQETDSLPEQETDDSQDQEAPQDQLTQKTSEKHQQDIKEWNNFLTNFLKEHE